MPEQPDQPRTMDTTSALMMVMTILIGLILLISLFTPISAPLDPIYARMKSMATAIEVYKIEQGSYPAWSREPELNYFGPLIRSHPEDGEPLETVPTFMRPGPDGAPYTLTTPVVYLPELPEDRFAPVDGASFAYWQPDPEHWILWSPGPDQHYDLRMPVLPEAYNPPTTHPTEQLVGLTYDPSNGALSSGDVYWVKKTY